MLTLITISFRPELAIKVHFNIGAETKEIDYETTVREIQVQCLVAQWFVSQPKINNKPEYLPFRLEK